MKNSFEYFIFDNNNRIFTEREDMSTLPNALYFVKIKVRLSRLMIETYYNKYVQLKGNKVMVKDRGAGSSSYFRILIGNGFSATDINGERLTLHTGVVNSRPVIDYDEHDYATFNVHAIAYTKNINLFLDNCKICFKLMSENQEKVRYKNLST